MIAINILNDLICNFAYFLKFIMLIFIVLAYDQQLFEPISLLLFDLIFQIYNRIDLILHILSAEWTWLCFKISILIQDGRTIVYLTAGENYRVLHHAKHYRVNKVIRWIARHLVHHLIEEVVIIPGWKRSLNNIDVHVQ